MSASKIQISLLTALFISLFILAEISFSQEQAVASDSTQENSLIKIYLDCASCDDDYFRTEINMASFVRDRKQADIHILITRQRTGGGGLEYTVEFIGSNHFAEMQDTLYFNSLESDSDDDIRSGLVSIIKLGLVRYIIRTPQKDKLEVNYLSTSAREEIIDKWNSWVFQLSSHMQANGQKSNKSYNFYGNMSARRVTEQLRLQCSAWGNYSERRFEFDDDVTLDISRGKGMSASSFFSLSDHWSIGATSNISSGTYSNFRSRLSLSPGLEFNYYPYSESTRRQLRFTYYPTMIYVDYEEITVYDKHNEWLARQSLQISLEMTEPWGEADISISASHYFHDISRYRINANGNLSLRVYEGLSVDFRGRGSRIGDQLSLRKAESSLEDVILGSTELPTTYNYYFSVGLSYSFGSIYNNVVNPRFGY